jgi:hypothetical protein
VDDNERSNSPHLLGPSAVEVLQADYPEWTIYRDMEGTSHGDWIAQNRDSSEQALRHATPEGLKKLLSEWSS